MQPNTMNCDTPEALRFFASARERPIEGEWMRKAADEIERLRDERLWIPVSARLPPEYETVLVATDGGVSAGEIRLPDSECGTDEPWWMVFKDRRDKAISWAGFVSLSDVTHWMPLPPPPTA